MTRGGCGWDDTFQAVDRDCGRREAFDRRAIEKQTPLLACEQALDRTPDRIEPDRHDVPDQICSR